MRALPTRTVRFPVRGRPAARLLALLPVLLLAATLPAPAAQAQEPSAPIDAPPLYLPVVETGAAAAQEEDDDPAAVQATLRAEQETAPVGADEALRALTAACADAADSCMEPAALEEALLTGAGSRQFTQDSSGVADTSESDDHFGSAVAVGDFNGDGYGDLAVSADWEGIGDLREAGAVHVLYGSSAGTRALGSHYFTQASPGLPEAAEAGDQFGYALAAGDFDGDGYDDLAIGAVGEDVIDNGVQYDDAGTVNVLYGSAGGLSTNGAQVFSQAIAGVPGDPDHDDYFVETLAAGDFDGDGRDDLAITTLRDNVPGLNGMIAGGSVTVLYGAAGGLSVAGAQLFSEATPGVPGDAELYDDFGGALAAGDFDGDGHDDLAIGIPGEDLTSSTDPFDGEGAVVVLYGSTGGLRQTDVQLFSQNSAGVPDEAESGDYFGFALAAGDFDGDGRDDLAIGAPNEDLAGNTVLQAGLVNVLYGSGAGLTGDGAQAISPETRGIRGGLEADDYFGMALAAGDFNSDGRDDLAVGAPGEGFTQNTVQYAGVVHVLSGTAGGLTASGARLLSQATTGLPEGLEAGDWFGEQLAVGNFNGDARDDLAVGVEDENLGTALFDAGAVNVFYAARRYAIRLPMVTAAR